MNENYNNKQNYYNSGFKSVKIIVILPQLMQKIHTFCGIF